MAVPALLMKPFIIALHCPLLNLLFAVALCRLLIAPHCLFTAYVEGLAVSTITSFNNEI